MKIYEIPSTFLMMKINIIVFLGCPFYASLNLNEENMSKEIVGESESLCFLMQENSKVSDFVKSAREREYERKCLLANILLTISDGK